MLKQSMRWMRSPQPLSQVCVGVMALLRPAHAVDRGRARTLMLQALARVALPATQLHEGGCFLLPSSLPQSHSSSCVQQLRLFSQPAVTTKS